jgi:hypothetical protein
VETASKESAAAITVFFAATVFIAAEIEQMNLNQPP